MWNRKKFHYLLHMVRTKIILLFAAVMTIAMLMLVFFGYRLEQQFAERLIDVNNGLLQYYAGIMETKFSAVELFFVEQRLQQNVYLRAESAQNELAQYLAAYEIRQIFDNSLYETDCLDSVFLYSPDNDTFVQRSYGLEDATEQMIAASMQEQIQKGLVTAARWTQHPIGESMYLYYIIPIHNSWVGGVLDMATLLEQIDLQQTETLQSVILLNRSFQPVSSTYVEENAAIIQSAVERGDMELTLHNKKYLISQTDVANGLFYLVGLMDKETIQGQTKTESRLFLLGAILLLGIGSGLVTLLWQSLITPLSHITAGMTKLQKGDFSYQLHEAKSSEFAQITTVFNTMGREIEHLKIAVYEERLERQTAELQFLCRVS